MSVKGIHVTFIPIPRYEETQSLNTMMAAGSAPDIYYTYSTELIAHFRDLGGLLGCDLQGKHENT